MVKRRIRRLSKLLSVLVCLSMVTELVASCVAAPWRNVPVTTTPGHLAQTQPEQSYSADVTQSSGAASVPVLPQTSSATPLPPLPKPTKVPAPQTPLSTLPASSLPPHPPGLASLKAQPQRAAFRVALNRPAGADTSMAPGWYLLSTLEQPADTRPAVVLASIAGNYKHVYAYDACDTTDPWKVYDPADPASSDLTVLDSRLGFWVEMTGTATLHTSGVRPTTTQIQLCQGWNLIGYPQPLALPVASALASIEGQYDRVFAWDPMNVDNPWDFQASGAPSWANQLQILQPGRGYWIHATRDTVLTFTPPSLPSNLSVPGFIGGPANTSTIDGQVPITLAEGVTLTAITVDYWPVNDLNAAQVLVTGVDAQGGETVATLDTTTLANGSYTIRISGTDSNGDLVASGIMVTVQGEYKPGRMRFTVTDLTVPVVGLPISIGRTYDSLERNQAGDFGFGWSLAIANPKLEVDPKHNVTLTMPDGKRTTFYFRPQFILSFGLPKYLPGAGVYGKLTASGCGLVVVSGGQYFCFPGGPYEESVAGYTYTDPYGRVYSMGVDGKLKSIEDLSDNALTFGPNGIASSVGGLQVAFERDSEGRITQITDPADNAYRYGYDAAGNLVSITLPGVITPTLYHYDSDHFFLSAQGPQGSTLAATTYYPDGRVESEIDALGNAFRFIYDVRERTTTEIYPDGGKAVKAYDTYGRLLSQVDPLSRTINFAYNANHDLTAVTNAAGETTRFVYDAQGNVTTALNALGDTVLSLTYNQYGGPTSVTDALGYTNYITYNANSLPISSADSLGPLSSYTWDDHGSMLTRQLGDASASVANNESSSPCHGLCQIFKNQVGTSQPVSRTLSYEYDESGRRISETDLLGRTTRYAYDVLGRTVSITNAEGAASHYGYDALGHLVAYTDTLGQVARFEYDAVGNRQAIIDPAGKRTSFQHDPLNRLVAVTYPDNATWTYTYDFRGNLLTTTDPTGLITQYEHDTAAQLLRVTRGVSGSLVSTLQYTYDTAGRMTSWTDALGHITTYAYDAAGQLLTMTAPLSQTMAYSYDALGQLVATTDANGRTIRGVYDARGQVTSAIYSDGSATQYKYDAVGDLIESAASCGVITRYEYDAVGQLVKVTEAANTPQARSWQYSYDRMGRVTGETDPLGHTTLSAYDVAGQLISETNPLGKVTAYDYDEIGRLVFITDTNGNVTQYAYDARDRLTLTTYADETTQQQTYDAVGRLVNVIDQAGRVTHREYDITGRLGSITRAYGTADASTYQYHYDVAGRLTGLTDPRSNLTTYVYDAANQLEQVVDPLGHPTTYAYDPVGQLISVVDANRHQTQFDYDVLGRLTRTTYADGTTDLRTYNCAGNLASTTDQAGKVTTYGYDDVGRVIAVTDPLSHTTHYDYDLADNLLAVTDANGHPTSFGYDALNRRIRKTLADGSFETYGYDAMGNLLNQRLTDGNTNTFVYNALNRLTQANYFDGQTVQYAYTPTGQRQTVTDGRGVTRYDYDGQDRLNQITQPDGRQVTYTYDGAGNRLSLATLAGTTHYAYDALNQLTNVTDPQGGVTSYAYDDVGLRTQQDLPNGVTVNYGYDALDRLTSLTQHKGSQVLASYTYALDPVGHRLSVTEADGSSTQWIYDDAYRLTGETRRNSGGTTVSQTDFTYDAGGNRLSETIDGVTTNYTYNVLDQLMTKGTAQYQYDGRGNLTRITDGASVTTLSYDARDRLTGAAMPGGFNANYQYDADDRRVQQTVGTQVTNYLWDEASPYGDVVMETNGTGGVLASYVLAGSELVSQRRNGSTSYYLLDGPGSIRALADASGDITDRYRYTAFGVLAERQGTTVNPYQYVGQQFDEPTGLYSLRARYYDPADGRFLSRDPLEIWSNVRELNRYAYAANDPVNLADPTGQQALIETGLNFALRGAVIGFVAGFAAGVASSGMFLVVAVLNMCGGQIQKWAANLKTGDILAYMLDSGIKGAEQGALAGAVTGLVAGLATVLTGSLMVGVVASNVASELFFGAGRAALEVLAQKDLCCIIPMVAGAAAGAWAGKFAAKQIAPRIPWVRWGNCSTGNCTSSSSFNPGGSPDWNKAARVGRDSVRKPWGREASIGTYPEYTNEGRGRTTFETGTLVDWNTERPTAIAANGIAMEYMQGKNVKVTLGVDPVTGAPRFDPMTGNPLPGSMTEMEMNFLRSRPFYTATRTPDGWYFTFSGPVPIQSGLQVSPCLKKMLE